MGRKDRLPALSQVAISEILARPKLASNPQWIEDLLLGATWVDARPGQVKYKHQVHLCRLNEGPFRGRVEAYVRINHHPRPVTTVAEMLEIDFEERSVGLIVFDHESRSAPLIRCNRGHGHGYTRRWRRKVVTAQLGPHVHMLTGWAMSHPAGRMKPDTFVVEKPRLRTIGGALSYLEHRANILNSQRGLL